MNGELTNEQVKKQFNKMYRQARIESGTDPYSGDWNTIDDIRIMPRIFDNEEEAYKWCSSKTEKCEAYAVKFQSFNTKKFNENSKVKSLKEKITEVSNKKSKINLETYRALKEAKSKTIACTKCESRINRSYLKSCKCPICGEDLRPKTILNKIDKIDKNIEELNGKLKILKMRQIIDAKQTSWLLFGLASC